MVIFMLTSRYFGHDLLGEWRHVYWTRITIRLIDIAGVFPSHRIVRGHHFVAGFVLRWTVILKALRNSPIKLPMLLLSFINFIKPTFFALKWNILFFAEI